jgi:branched-chain amino acid transport system permease protein
MIHAQTLCMLEAYLAATFQGWTDSFVLGVILAMPLTFAIGMVVEMVALWTL